MSNLKVEGKVADFCPKCKNCNYTAMECYEKKIRLTKVECEDPYDGMKKILDPDSDICCSMFEPVTSKDKYSELEARYSDNDVVIEAKRLSEESRIEEIREGLMKFAKAFTNEELIKASKRKDELIQNYREKLKGKDNEINLLNSKLDKLGEYYRTDEKLIDNIQNVIFPQEEGSDYTYSYEEILNEIRDLKIYGDENRTMYEEIKKLRAKNQEYFNEIHERLAKHTDQCYEIAKLKKEKEELIRRYNMIAKKLNDIHDILKEESDNE